MKSFSCTWSLTSVGLRREISQKQFVPQDHRSHHGLRFPADFTPQRDDIGRWFSFFIPSERQSLNLILIRDQSPLSRRGCSLPH